jgi:hypothetical protein
MTKVMEGVTDVAPAKRLYNMLSGGAYWEFKATKRIPNNVVPKVID